MHFTLHQLKVFESVARNRSYTRAAEELFLTQPAISMQVKQLERNLGLPLLEHLGKRLHLTDAGNEVCHYARTLAQQIEEMEAVLARLRGIDGGTLRISVASTANYFAPRLLAAFGKRHQGVRFSLDVTNRDGLLRHLEANDIDLVIMGKPPEGLDVEATAFMENPLVVIAPPDHPLVGTSRIPLERLQQESFVLRERGSGTRIAMERFFAERGIRLATGMELSSNEGIKQAVEARLGLGIVSRHTLELFLEARRLVVLDVEGFPILRNWYVVHRRGKRLTPVASAFKDFVFESARGSKNPP